MAYFQIEAEIAVIGSIFIDPESIEELYIHPHQFYDNKHKVIFKTIKEVYESGQPIDIVTIVTQLTTKNMIESIGGVSYLIQIAEGTPTSANIKYYEEIVIESWKMRRIYEIADELKNKSADGDPNVISEYVQKLTEIETSNDAMEFDSKEALVRTYDKLFMKKEGLTGISSGFTDIDNLIDGWKEQDLIIIAARPSMGKTAFGLNVGFNAITSDKNKDDIWLDIFSLEMPDTSLLTRTFSFMGNINSMKLRNAMDLFDPEDFTKLTMVMGELSNTKFNIYDKPGPTVEEIRAKVRKNNKEAKKLGMRHMVIIDYLQLIQYKGDQKNTVQQMGHISKTLKVMARELNVCVIALSQLSRGVESRQDKRPMMSDIRESGQIEQDADIIAFLYRDDYYNSETEKKGITEIIIAKDRNGPIGTVELAFIKEYNKFVNLERRMEG